MKPAVPGLGKMYAKAVIAKSAMEALSQYESPGSLAGCATAMSGDQYTGREGHAPCGEFSGQECCLSLILRKTMTLFAARVGSNRDC